MLGKVGDVMMPGDIADDVEQASQSKKVILGPGLRRQGEKVIACKAGILKSKAPNTFWIDSYQKRYIPSRGETVIGIVVQKAGDIYRVEIGASETACLSYLAFEGKKYIDTNQNKLTADYFIYRCNQKESTRCECWRSSVCQAINSKQRL